MSLKLQYDTWLL